MDYKAYLFDFDGTLVNSMPAFASVMLRILDENNIKYSDDIVKIITPLGYAGIVRYYKNLGMPQTETEIMELMRQYLYDEYAHNIMAKEDVISVLKQLRNSGASLNILTASPHLFLDVCLKRLGIFELFDNVWSCDDFGTTKTDVEIYKRAAARIGLPVEKVLFLDDNYNADKTAKDSGMMVCGVYDETSEEYADEIKSVADYYIHSFTELL